MNRKFIGNIDCSIKAPLWFTFSLLGLSGFILAPSVRADAVTLDTLVVTGEKIEKSIKDTSTAVTVFTEDRVDSGDFSVTQEVVTQTPNVVTDSFGNISIRGMSGGGAANGGAALITGSRARVTTVIDGSTQDWSGYNFTPEFLWDVRQVEVLRGPQSTAQGPSAIAGAVVITTNDPVFKKEAALRTGLESYKNGNLKYQLSAMTSGPIIDETLAYRLAIHGNKGEGWLNYEAADFNVPDLDESESLNVRGKLLWLPSSLPNLSAKMTLTHHKNEGEHASFASNTDEGIRTQTLDITSAAARLQDSEETAAALDIDYQISEGITSVLHLNHIRSDIYANGYMASNVFNYDIDQKSTAIENRVVLNRPSSAVTGVIGLFAARKTSSIFATQGPVTIDTDYTTNTTAAFGEGTYAFSPSTSATVGLRIENEKIDKTGSLLASGPLQQDSDETYYLPKLGLMQGVSDSTTLGFTVRKGYSPGGSGITFDGDVYTYDSEEVTSYELSSKSEFGEGAALYASLFYNKYDDYQALSGLALFNVDQSHIYGAELEASIWPTNSLELTGSVGILKSKIDAHDTFEGNELPSVPDSNLRIGLTQFIGNAWSVGADISYVGKYYSELDNDHSAKVGDVVITDLRAQYQKGDFTVDAYVKNLADEHAVYYRVGALATVGQTRTVGLSMTYRM
ncbi:MAG: TonB-dependent receptor [Marinobacter sp.]|uniref:TonB-dependent receptor n=1 Tax=Marinobacter sp. TaxID=50741 RepID=UPI003F959098